MQQYSFPDNTCEGLIVHPDERADWLKQRMLAERGDVLRTVDYLDQIALILCQHVRDYIAESYGARRFVPILVMRGGLVMRLAVERVFPQSPMGLIVPFRKSSLEEPGIVYGDVPAPSYDALYLVCDLLLATGRTMIAALESVYANVRPVIGDEMQVVVLTPFAAYVGVQSVLEQLPDVVIHAIWHQEKVDENQRMIGPGFDIGDYALGGESPRRVQWAWE